eukprot:TRINITY_DN6511_c0_g1_i1.p1 TRINITY_DN6511_c0_g1~~TRINITY_DN6511_c0_g1_i1.p1  ORF type:complete len:154 (+),score=25.43 TRINITY_DN6511_c0_g1_i1:43-504(+)
MSQQPPAFIGPRVGVGVFILKNDQFLVGIRRGNEGSGTLALPGGKLEGGESFEECAIREIYEETNIRISNPRFIYSNNILNPELKTHWVVIFMAARVDETAEPTLMEPDKCAGWEWQTVEQVKTYPSLFAPLADFLGRQLDPFHLYEAFASHS